jgi:hypothetical protein
MNRQFRQYRQDCEIDDPVALRGHELHRLKNIEGGLQSIVWFFQEDMWRFEEDCGTKISLIPNHYWLRPQSRGQKKAFPKVISREYLSENELTPNTLRFRRRVKGEVAGVIRPAPRS